MSEIPDFSENELWIVRTALNERFGKAVEPQLADCELRLDAANTALVSCPSLFWSEIECNFVLFKTGADNFRCQFFYEPREMFGTGIENFDNIGDCVMTLLRAQADSDAERKGHLEKTS